MKKVFAFFLLLCHMNGSMFLPQVEEEDVYDANGQQLDDINSIAELISVELGYDKTPDDEDTDTGQNFHYVKTIDYNYEQPSALIVQDAFRNSRKHEFTGYQVPATAAPCYDIVTPPPDNC